jgi:deazaflavin-dependent oxidoreductase (nitroreductase family)
MKQLVLVPSLRFHDMGYRKTNGRIGHRMIPGLPSSLLHTTGAKTGKPRTTSLTYARDGDAYLIVGSNGGDPGSPGWYQNPKADPDTEINVGPKRFPVKAKPLLRYGAESQGRDITRWYAATPG